MYLGVHVSISGNIADSVARAEKLGCTAMQIFSRNPRSWRGAGLPEEDAAEFRRRIKLSSIRIVAVHAPYLINLATPDDVLYKKSIDAYVEDMRETAALGAQYLVTHMGSFKDSTLSYGIDRFINALDIVFSLTKELKNVKLLLENTSGAGNCLGYTFEHHKIIFDKVKDNSRLGVCLDTAHAFAAGIDIRTSQIFDGLIDSITAGLGQGALRLLHLNDSMSECGSRIDRHDHIGKGFIGLEPFRHIVNHPSLIETAFILETPKDKPTADKLNLNRVRRLFDIT